MRAAALQCPLCYHGRLLLRSGPCPSIGAIPGEESRDEMKIHEYQGKEILKRYGVPVPRGIPSFSVDEAVKAAEQLGGPVWVVKAQIHAGGRG